LSNPTISSGERVTLGAPFFWGCGEREGLGVSVALGDGLSSGVAVGVGEAFLRFDFVFGVAVGEGVGELFLCFGEAVGDGLGVAFVAELFLCLRFGAGVGVAKIFLIFVPNESSAASGVTIKPRQIVLSRRPRRVIFFAGNNQCASS